jgi:CPA2 family monovalent cation:H+ antiporter-2
MPPLAVGGDYGVLVELGALLIGLGMLARLADRVGIPTIPVYLVAGMALGELGEGPITFSSELIAVGADLGLVLLLFMLGLESSGEELRRNLARAAPAGAVDAIANFTPGLVAGLLLGWDLVPALLLGGATYISSSGVVAKLLDDLDRLANRETPAILSILVIEDLAMAAFLPLVSVLLVGTGIVDAAGLLVAALGAAGVALWVAMTRGHVLSRLLTVRSDEVLLLLTLGLVVLVAGAAEALQLSAPVGAFLVGIALSGPVAERARRILSPLRDLFAATFFVFFGLGSRSARCRPSRCPRSRWPSSPGRPSWGRGCGRRPGSASGRAGRLRAGTSLVARGEFSVIVAGIGVAAGAEAELGPLVAAYVLVTVLAGSALARAAG